jgi:hypothetical protein
MFDNLSVNSQQAITSLIKGLPAKVGKSSISTLDNDKKSLLALLSLYFNQLKSHRAGFSKRSFAIKHEL